MATKSVSALLDDIRFVNEQSHDIIQAVRALIHKTIANVSEEVKYGGILFTASVQFGGVFAYKEHATVEFSYGATIDDQLGFLEGNGKGRRHIKLQSVTQIKEKKLAQYLTLALQAAQKETS